MANNFQNPSSSFSEIFPPFTSYAFNQMYDDQLFPLYHETLFGSQTFHNPNFIQNPTLTQTHTNISVSKDHTPYNILLNSPPPPPLHAGGNVIHESNFMTPPNNDFSNLLINNSPPPPIYTGGPIIQEQTDVPNPRSNLSETRSKRRGRPLGSKNKSKGKAIDKIDSNKSYTLKILQGCDIIKTIENFTREHKIGLFVLNGTGQVQKFSIFNNWLGKIVDYIDGPYDIEFMQGTFIKPAFLKNKKEAHDPSNKHIDGLSTNNMILEVGGRHMERVWGKVEGPLMAASVVTIIGLPFTNNKSCIILPKDPDPNTNDDDPDEGDNNCGPSSRPNQREGKRIRLSNDF